MDSLDQGDEDDGLNTNCNFRETDSAKPGPKIEDEISKKRKIIGGVDRLLYEGWEAFSEAPTLKPRVQLVPNTPKFKFNSWKNHPVKVFNVVAEGVFEFLLPIINNNLFQKYNQAKKLKHSGIYDPVDSKLLKRIYGVLIAAENSYSKLNNNLQANIKDIFSKRENFVGLLRCREIITSFTPTVLQLLEITKILNTNFGKAYNFGTICGDESQFPYQLRGATKIKWKNEIQIPFPHSFIPRKPHKNGILFYQWAIFSQETGLPFLVMTTPYVDTGNRPSAHASVKLFLETYSSTQSLLLVCDSAYGSMSTLDLISKKGHYGVFSLGGNSSSYIKRMLEKGLGCGDWNAVTNCDKYILSVSCSWNKNENCYGKHYCITNFFTAEDKFLYSTQKFQKEMEEKKKKKKEEERKEEAKQKKKKKSKPKITLNDPKKSHPSFSDEFLEDQGTKSLKKLCKDMDLPFQRTNEKTRKMLKEVTNYDLDFTQSVEKRIFEGHFKTPPVHHETYNKNFKAVDSFDELFGRVSHLYKVRDWRRKFLFDLMEFLVINSYTLYNEVERTELKEFRTKLAKDLMDEQDF